MSKYYSQDEAGFDVIYGMTETDYNKKIFEICALHRCDYHRGMDIFHRQYCQEEYTQELIQARDKEAKEEKMFHADSTDRDNELYLMSMNLTKGKNVDWYKVYTKLHDADTLNITAERLVKTCHSDPVKIVEFQFKPEAYSNK